MEFQTTNNFNVFLRKISLKVGIAQPIKMIYFSQKSIKIAHFLN